MGSIPCPSTRAQTIPTGAIGRPSEHTVSTSLAGRSQSRSAPPCLRIRLVNATARPIRFLWPVVARLTPAVDACAAAAQVFLVVVLTRPDTDRRLPAVFACHIAILCGSVDIVKGHSHPSMPASASPSWHLSHTAPAFAHTQHRLLNVTTSPVTDTESRTHDFAFPHLSHVVIAATPTRHRAPKRRAPSSPTR